MIRLIKPYISFNEMEEELKEILGNGILTSGKYSKSLPKEIVNYTGAKYAFNTTSATTALSMVMELLDIGPQDEVIVSDFSFPATSNVVEQRGATTVFADVSLKTYNMEKEELESKITKRTKAVIFVCALGNPTGLHEAWSICRKYDIPFIVDAACALGSSEKGIKVGNIGDISCFSFHPRKLVTSGEGGMITTSNPEYAKKLSIKLNHGAIVEDGKLRFVDYGFNYRLPEIQCVMILKQLEQLDIIISERIATREYYQKELGPFGFEPQAYAKDCIHNMQSVVFTVPSDLDRDELIQYLRNHDVESVFGTYSLSNCVYNKNKYGNVQPNALWLQNNTICLPCYHGVEQEIVVKVIMDYIKGDR